MKGMKLDKGQAETTRRNHDMVKKGPKIMKSNGSTR